MKRQIIPIFMDGDTPSPTPTDNYAVNMSMTMDSNYIISAKLIDQDGNVLGDEQTIDLPLESVVVSGSYDSNTKSIILTLDNGNTITIPVSDLISGLQPTIDANNKLNADYIADGTTNKVFTASDKQSLMDAISATSNLGTMAYQDASNYTPSASLGSMAFANTSDYTPTASLSTVATTGQYSDLSGIPTINDSTITIEQDGVTAGTFTLNQSSNATISLTGGSGGGGNEQENQLLLPLYFENISDNDIDVKLILVYNQYVGYRPSINLSKSTNKVDWTSINIPTTSGGLENITIPAKSRVYIKGTNTRFCNFQTGGYYNHYYFTLGNVQNFKSLDTPYIYVGGNLMSLLLGDTFLTRNTNYPLDNYCFTKLFFDNLYENGTGYIEHFEKMIIGLPLADITPTTGSLSRVHSNYVCPLNLSHRSIFFQQSNTDCAKGSWFILVNERYNNINSIDTDTNNQNSYRIGYTEKGVGISDYRQLNNTPTIPAAQIQSDWTQTDNTSLDYIKNKPNLATVATSGSYNDLSNKPTIPTVNNAALSIKKDSGTKVDIYSANASTAETINLVGGTNVSLTEDTSTANTYKMTIDHSTPSGATTKTSGFYKFSTDSQGHVNGTTAVTASDITSLVTIPSNTQTLTFVDGQGNTTTITFYTTA